MPNQLDLYLPPDAPTYTVQTWDPELHDWTPHEGLSVPSRGVSIHGLRRVLKELRTRGYPCDYFRGEGDPSVLVLRDE